MIKCIVFDLDGTLVKSHETIYKTTIKTLEKLNLDTNLDQGQFYSLLGHHFQDIFDECNITVPDVEYFINVYKNLYFDYIEYSHVYENAMIVLEELANKGIRTGLLTTKGHDQAIKLSQHFGFSNYLGSIEGRKNGVAIKPAPDQFLNICNYLNVMPSNSMMIGDTELDIRCGKAAGAKTCAVSFGYRSVEEIKNENPDYLINDLIEILKII